MVHRSHDALLYELHRWVHSAQLREGIAQNRNRTYGHLLTMQVLYH